ncbi:MAG: reverse transcriptase domain-containing protein [Candidatus Woesearchaeota archaeon]
MNYQELCSYQNLELAFKKARKGKTTKDYVIAFEKDMKENLTNLRYELLLHSYRPKPLEIFIIRDPKTRTISKSDFRDRVVHHALCNVIAPTFEKHFIHDSYANQVGKGALKAISRFDEFTRIASNNYTKKIFVLKADIRKYFENVNHNVLLELLQAQIKDKKILWLIKLILSNHATKVSNKGMPLGNLTSQFFANVYLHELDLFVKHIIKAKYYIRYVDDFIIINKSKNKLKQFKKEINKFLLEKLDLELHPEKSRIIQLQKGINFLGFRIFPQYKLLVKKNLRKFKAKLNNYSENFPKGCSDYDKIYDFLEGWTAYAKYASTYKLRKEIFQSIEPVFENQMSTKEINRYLKTIKNHKKS